MSQVMSHNGYQAVVAFDADLEMFRGEVVNTAAHIDFYADTVKGLKREFEASVNEYLAVCRERGIRPEKGYSGKFQLRLDPDLHARLAASAAASDQSLNAWIVDTLREAAEKAQSGD